MRKTATFVISSVLFYSGAAPWAASEASDNRWSFAVDGMPKIEGSLFTTIGSGSNARYALASDEASVNISRRGAGKPVSLMLKYRDAGFNCTSSGKTVVEEDGGKLVVSGEVICREAGASPTRPTDKDYFAIEGWFDPEQ